MDKLPAELFSDSISHLVFLHLGRPLNQSALIRSLLDLRLVCRAFDKEILRNLHQTITLPHLSSQRRAFQENKRSPAGINSKRNRSLTGVNSIQNSIIASALFNSTISTSNRLLCTSITSRIRKCVKYAQEITGHDSESSIFALTRIFCTVAAKSGVCHSILFDGMNILTDDTDRFCIAVILGDVEFVKDASKRRRVGSRVSSIFGYPTSCAALCGHVDIVRHLIRTLQWRYGYLDGTNAIELAIENAQLDVLRLFMDNQYGVDKFGSKYAKYVDQAVRTGNVEVVKQLLQAMDPGDFPTKREYERERTRQMHSALMCACRFGQTEVVRLLLQYGLDVNKCIRYEVSALEIAKSRGYTNIVEMLLEAGAGK
ncbi:ankyrin [Zopfia rhizophila CBS 207.26]|uniref:Ankyrin n=1 Tax=Zopfia rhizophila CBS 207.26 TaxID=1314779 RepID=A0A6A6EG12_9PEZI|nr:ankyrin [Zopfia rhizophila CBS 207.26]